MKNPINMHVSVSSPWPKPCRHHGHRMSDWAWSEGCVLTNQHFQWDVTSSSVHDGPAGGVPCGAGRRALHAEPMLDQHTQGAKLKGKKTAGTEKRTR